MMMPKSFYAAWKSSLSFFDCISTVMILAPARSCMIIDEVIMGEMPNSIKVPLLEARMTRSQ